MIKTPEPGPNLTFKALPAAEPYVDRCQFQFDNGLVVEVSHGENLNVDFSLEYIQQVLVNDERIHEDSRPNEHYPPGWFSDEKKFDHARKDVEDFLARHSFEVSSDGLRRALAQSIGGPAHASACDYLARFFFRTPAERRNPYR